MKITEENYFLSGVSYHMNKITGFFFFWGGEHNQSESLQSRYFKFNNL